MKFPLRDQAAERVEHHDAGHHQALTESGLPVAGQQGQIGRRVIAWPVGWRDLVGDKNANGGDAEQPIGKAKQR
jgi:hypothetical protein